MVMPDNKIKKFFRSEFKKANFKSFVLFLCLSSIIWIFVQYSKKYTEVINVPLQYVNAPKDKLVTDRSGRLQLRVKQTGFQMAWFKIFKPKIKVDLAALPADSTALIYDVVKHHKKLSQVLPLNMDNAQFVERRIRIPYARKAIKKVPVVPQITIQYAPGYSSVQQQAILVPDSIKISGSHAILDSITHISTERISLKDINSDVKGAVALDNPNRELTLFRKEVSYLFKVERFTERQLEIPITVINKPKGVDISLYPSSVKITFNVSLKKFNQFQKMDFQVVCDYRNISQNKQFLIPSIKRKPDEVHQIRLSPRKVQFVIKQ